MKDWVFEQERETIFWEIVVYVGEVTFVLSFGCYGGCKRIVTCHNMDVDIQ